MKKSELITLVKEVLKENNSIFGVIPQNSDGKVIFTNPTIGDTKYGKLVLYNNGDIILDSRSLSVNDLANSKYRMNKEDSQKFNTLLKSLDLPEIEFYVNETSSTGTGASTTSGDGMGVATKYAFKKKTNEIQVANKNLNPNPPKTLSPALQKFEKVVQRKNQANINHEYELLDKVDKKEGWNFVKKYLPKDEVEKLMKYRGEVDKSLNEVSSRDYNKQVSATPKQKANNAYRLVRKKLNEIDAILAYSSRLKEELGSSWTLNEKQLTFVQEKMKSLTGKLKTLTK